MVPMRRRDRDSTMWEGTWMTILVEGLEEMMVWRMSIWKGLAGKKDTLGFLPFFLLLYSTHKHLNEFQSAPNIH